MPAIITDQFRVMNAETFIKSLVSVGNTANNYYTFIGQPNSLNPQANGSSIWGDGLPPLDGFEEENRIKETIIALKKVTGDDIRRMVRKVQWTSGTTYEMYRHDYTIYNKTPVTKQSSLYNANFYVINEDFRVYLCLQNGSDPENPNGRPSFDQPQFIDLEPRPAGTSGDGYIWKYMYTIKPSEVVKFDSIEFIPVPENWGLNGETISTKNNAIDGKIEVVAIKNRGTGYQPISKSFTNIPILGDGIGGKVTITVDSFGKVSEVFVTDGGSGYTKGNIRFEPGAPGIPSELSNGSEIAEFDVIIPPKGGHGYDIYRELGANRVLIYSRYITDPSNPDIILGNDFSRIGVIKNPTISGSNTELLTLGEVSALDSLKLTGLSTQTTYPVDSVIKQTIGLGATAVGFVASWDNVTGVLKYYQPVGLATAGVNYKINKFTSLPAQGGSLSIDCQNIVGPVLSIDTAFSGISTVINNRTYQLGSNFVSGISSSEYNKKSGEIIYIDNRKAIPRSSSQKEDIKIILEF
jgi:hypothetical protein